MTMIYKKGIIIFIGDLQIGSAAVRPSVRPAAMSRWRMRLLRELTLRWFAHPMTPHEGFQLLNDSDHGGQRVIMMLFSDSDFKCGLELYFFIIIVQGGCDIWVIILFQCDSEDSNTPPPMTGHKSQGHSFES